MSGVYMLFPSNKKWEEWGISSKAHKFFIQKWQDLFSDETFVSWQVRTSNLQTILDELLEAIEVAKQTRSFKRNVEILIREAKRHGENDLIIKEHFPHTTGYIHALKKEYKSNSKEEQKKDFDKIKRLTLILQASLKNYRNILLKELKNIIENPPEKKYQKKLDNLTMALAIVLKAEGYSTLSLQDSLQILLQNDISVFPDRVEKLFHQFSGTIQKYSVKFLISWPKFNDFDLTSFGINIADRSSTDLLSEVDNSFYEKDTKAKVATVDVNSLDFYSARKEAEEKLENFFSFVALYLPNRQPKVRVPEALVIAEDGYRKITEQDNSRLRYIRDSKKPELNIPQLAELCVTIKTQDSDQITASLQYHKLSMLARSDESRLVNLWIALESLFQQGKGAIIGRICDYLPSSLALDYPLNISKNLPINIRALWRKSNPSGLLAHLKFSNRHMLNPYDMLSIFLDSEDGVVRSAFNNFSSDHPLLLYRVYRLGKEMFKKPKHLKKRLEEHRETIEWQICRIYRGRNFVMHQGICPNRVRQLIQHLHIYYILVIHSLIQDLRFNNNWSIFDAFEHRRTLFEHFLYRLEHHKDYPVSKEEILYPYRTLSTRNKDDAW